MFSIPLLHRQALITKKYIKSRSSHDYCAPPGFYRFFGYVSCAMRRRYTEHYLPKTIMLCLCVSNIFLCSEALVPKHC